MRAIVRGLAVIVVAVGLYEPECLSLWIAWILGLLGSSVRLSSVGDRRHVEEEREGKSRLGRAPLAVAGKTHGDAMTIEKFSRFILTRVREGCKALAVSRTLSDNENDVLWRFIQLPQRLPLIADYCYDNFIN